MRLFVCLALGLSATAHADIVGDPEAASPNAAPNATPATQPAMTNPASTPTVVAAPEPVMPEAKTAQNALYVEVGGNSAWYSVNYERFLRPDTAVRIGMSYMSITATAGSGMNSGSASATWATVPVMLDYMGLHSGSHAIELGAGVNLMYFSGNSSTFDATASASGVIPVGTATVGYRYSSPSGGFIFRAGYTPLFFVTTSVKQVFNWGGISFGYRF